MIRVGIAGIGYIAEEYIKLFTAGKIAGAAVTALSSRSKENMEAVNDRYHLNASLFTDYEAMLESGCIDMVMICTPPLLSSQHGHPGHFPGNPHHD